jgi:hypothetical protein
MLWSLKNNVLLLQSPKTGSTTLRMWFKLNASEGLKYNNKYVHLTYPDIEDRKDELSSYLGRDPDKFDHYVFYRSPLEKFYSLCTFARYEFNRAYNNQLNNQTQLNMYDTATLCFNDIFDADNFDVKNIQPEHFLYAIKKLRINEILNYRNNYPQNGWNEFYKMLETHGCTVRHFPMWDLFRPQVGWYIRSHTNLLDFRHYAEEFKRVCDMFETRIPNTVPKMNYTERYTDQIRLAASQEQEVIDFYKTDYDFFINKGLNFDEI